MVVLLSRAFDSTTLDNNSMSSVLGTDKKCIIIEECTQLTVLDRASLCRAAMSTYWKRTGQLSHVSLPDVGSLCFILLNKPMK